MFLRLTAILALGCFLLGVPAADAAKRRSCAKIAPYPIAANQKALVYAKRDGSNFAGDYDYAYYACLRRNPKPLRLGAEEYLGGSGSGGTVPFIELRGTLVGYVQQDYGESAGSYKAVTVNLKTRRRVRFHSGLGFVHGAGMVARTGSLAFLTSAGRVYPDSVPYGGYTVWKLDAQGTTALDSGPDIDRESLAVSQSSSTLQSQIYWLRGGQPKTAPIE